MEKESSEFRGEKYIDYYPQPDQKIENIVRSRMWMNKMNNTYILCTLGRDPYEVKSFGDRLYGLTSS